jgi:hypothetical protein
MKFLSSLLLLIAPVALSLPVTEAPVEDAALESRQSCYSRCGSTCYTANQVTAARNAGYSFYNQDKTAGSSNYPHQYNNFEGFQFLVSGPYQEFPIRSSGVYSGGTFVLKSILLKNFGVLTIPQDRQEPTVSFSTRVASALEKLRIRVQVVMRLSRATGGKLTRYFFYDVTGW